MSHTKRSEYLLPIFPAMALLVGYAIDRGLREGSDSLFRRRLFVWPTYVLFGIIVAVGIGFGIYGAILSLDWFLTVLPAALFPLCGAALAFVLFRRNRLCHGTIRRSFLDPGPAQNQPPGRVRPLASSRNRRHK